jgi:hypothetical protein
MPQITMIKPKRKAFRLFGVSGIMTISFFALVVWRAISLTSQTSNLVAMVGIYPDHHAVDMHVREKDELSGKGPLGCRTLVSRLRFFPCQVSKFGHSTAKNDPTRARSRSRNQC